MKIPEESRPRNGAQSVDRVVVRFAGDSGDGMQVTGNQFTSTAAFVGNDVSTFPDYPAEIRAPAGSLPGVSGFQIHFASHDIHTPGDDPDVLVAMNPAALKVHLGDLPTNGLLIVNTDAFTEKTRAQAGYDSDPLEDGSLEAYRVVGIPITRLTREVLEGVDLSRKLIDRCKNFFALGVMFYLYNRPTEPTETWLAEYFGSKPEVVTANVKALRGGIAYCENTEVFQTTYKVERASFPAGRYRNINGNTALSLGLMAGARQTGVDLFLASYPITPATDILHELSRRKSHGVMTFQAEDEIAAICAAIGASYTGKIGITTTSGPGLALKTEALGLAISVEIPLIVVNVQRGGPSTGLPTKTEQADLLQAIFGRNSEAPLPVLAACTPGDCFWTALEAIRLATRYMTPVLLLSDGYLANGAEPWPIPSVDELPDMPVTFHTDADGFQPYARDEQTLARPWVRPGTPGLEHRVGGLEKEHITGNVSYDGANHEFMVRLRDERIRNIANDIPEVEVDGPESGGTLIVGWGSTHGSIRGALRRLRQDGAEVSHVHLRHLNPLPRNLGEVLSRFDRVIVPELNLGQLAWILRARYLIDIDSLTKIEGKPFKSQDIVEHVQKSRQEVPR